MKMNWPRRLFVLSSYGVVTLGCLVALLTAVPTGAAGESLRTHRDEIRTFLPEGWAFFTRDAQEADVLLFRRAGVGWKGVEQGPDSMTGDLGLDRTRRAKGVELAPLLAQLPDQEGTACRLPVSECLDAIAGYDYVVNRSVRPELCGQVAVVRRRPVPFAWRSSRDSIVMPSTILALDVSC